MDSCTGCRQKGNERVCAQCPAGVSRSSSGRTTGLGPVNRSSNLRRESKYRNKKTEVDGTVFDSKREAARWTELKLLESQGEIWNLQRQVKFELIVNGLLICQYIADFVYRRQDGAGSMEIIEDAKGRKIQPYPIKKKLMRAIHGIEIQEV